MNQLCRVCGEPAAGFHFGAFTCEGCKSFFGRTYNNLSQIHECKNGGACVINKQNRTSCKACRLKKCLVVGMSKSGSKYGRRSNWFKIHCLLQEQAAAQAANKSHEGGTPVSLGSSPTPMTSMSPTFVSSLSPTPMTSLSPCRNDEESKSDTSALSSPDSESSIDIIRRTCRKDIRDVGLPGSDFVANLGLYSLHPGLSLLHASHLYSRLYPPVLYPSLPHLLPSSRSPPASHSPLSPHTTHSPPVPHSPEVPRSPSVSPTPLELNSLKDCSSSQLRSQPMNSLKRRAESPYDDQDGPIDLTVKRFRSHSPLLDASRRTESPIVNLLPLTSLNVAAPVNLTTKA